MYLILPFLPFASSILAGFFGRFIGSRYASFATTFLIALTFCSALICFCNICLVGESVSIKLADWVSCGLFSINWGFLFDPLSISVICVVTGVSTLVHLYSSSYMSEDPHLCRFMS
jgi:NADH:ubiquinone oxidoreductase subunit 5 (subunit L)/multisubunit Na+/H+ antiporter MnhA subunit